MEKDHINIVFIGHVDHGKSTLVGRILCYTGLIDPKTVEKCRRISKDRGRESWFLAYLLDTTDEEMEKGKTIETGIISFETDKRRITILDAPGHKNYVPNMIKGVAQADIGVLVVSARRGEFEKGFCGGQTKEHVLLAKTLGLNRLIVVINKMDDSTVEWDQARFNDIQKKMIPFLRKSGYSKNTLFVPISGFLGQNIKDRIDSNICDWYTGQSLLEVLDTVKGPKRENDGPLRVSISGVYPCPGKSIMIKGKVESGTIHLNQDVIILPLDFKSTVLELSTTLNDFKKCGVGENIQIVLDGTSSEMLKSIKSGYIISGIKDRPKIVKQFVAKMMIKELPKENPILTSKFMGILHIHNIKEECEIARIIKNITLDSSKKDTKQNNKNLKDINLWGKIGDMINCIIKIKNPICVETYADIKKLGQFTIRNGSHTIGIGTIIRLPNKA